MKLLTTLTVLAVFVAAAKILLFWITLTLKSKPKSKLYAEDIIKQQDQPAAGPIKQSSIVVEQRPKVKEYESIKNHFKTLLQQRQLTREDLKAIRRYLDENVPVYEVKRFKNEAHAIYSMLKWAELEQLLEVNRFLNTKEDTIIEKTIIQTK